MTLNLGWNRFRNCLKGLNKVFRTLIVFCLFTVVSLAETQINPLGKQTGTTYDVRGNVLSVVNEIGSVSSTGLTPKVGQIKSIA